MIRDYAITAALLALMLGGMAVAELASPTNCQSDTCHYAMHY